MGGLDGLLDITFLSLSKRPSSLVVGLTSSQSQLSLPPIATLPELNYGLVLAHSAYLKMPEVAIKGRKGTKEAASPVKIFILGY